jgi:hypothetical protein
MRALVHAAVTIWLLLGCTASHAADSRADHVHASTAVKHAHEPSSLGIADVTDLTGAHHCGESEFVVANQDTPGTGQTRAVPPGVGAALPLPQLLKAGPFGQALDRGSPFTFATLLEVPLRL